MLRLKLGSFARKYEKYGTLSKYFCIFLVLAQNDNKEKCQSRMSCVFNIRCRSGLPNDCAKFKFDKISKPSRDDSKDEPSGLSLSKDCVFHAFDGASVCKKTKKS